MLQVQAMSLSFSLAQVLLSSSPLFFDPNPHSTSLVFFHVRISPGLSSSQNPFYPVTIQRNSTTVTVCLSVWDRAWQVDPSRRGPAIGYYVVRLVGWCHSDCYIFEGYCISFALVETLAAEVPKGARYFYVA